MTDDEMAKAASAEAHALARFQIERGVVADVAVTAAALLMGLVAAAVARDKPELDALLDTLGLIARQRAYDMTALGDGMGDGRGQQAFHQ
jgi:hypothetical protein